VLSEQIVYDMNRNIGEDSDESQEQDSLNAMAGLLD